MHQKQVYCQASFSGGLLPFEAIQLPLPCIRDQAANVPCLPVASTSSRVGRHQLVQSLHLPKAIFKLKQELKNPQPSPSLLLQWFHMYRVGAVQLHDRGYGFSIQGQGSSRNRMKVFGIFLFAIRRGQRKDHPRSTPLKSLSDAASSLPGFRELVTRFRLGFFAHG